MTVRSRRPIHARELAMVGISSFALFYIAQFHVNVGDSVYLFGVLFLALGLC